MRLLISAVANEHFGDRIAAVDPSIERVVMDADGIIRDLAGTPVDADLPIEVDLSDGRREEHVRAGCGRERGVALLLARIALEVGLFVELGRVDE